MKLAFFSTKSYDAEYFDRANKQYGHEINYFETRLKEKTVNLTRGYEAICVFINDQLDSATMCKMSDLGVKVILLRATGFNHIDLEQADKCNMKVLRVPAYSPESVAEHALALIMTLNRKTHKAYNRVREHNFSLEKMTGFNLHGKTVGVIGTGRIGTAFAGIMLGMGCRVLGFDKYESDELKDKGVDYQTLESLLGASDIVSLHCPLNDETMHLINRDTIQKMKDGSMLINTSRGGLIKTHDVIGALKSGKLGYMGIDVYEQEERLFFRDLSETIIHDDDISRLMTFPNVLITSHQAFFTHEALSAIADTTLKNLDDYQNGRELVNEVKFQAK